MARGIAAVMLAALVWALPASAPATPRAPNDAGIGVDGPSGDPPARLVVARWSTEPLTAGVTEILELTAVDPNGVPTIFWVDFGDGVVFNVDILCLPNTPPGTPMTTRLTHAYAEPGTFRVRAIAISFPSCTGGSEQRGIGRGVSTLVEPPLG
jgi:hypothetical protein